MSKNRSGGFPIFGLIGFFLTVFAVYWLAMNVHPQLGNTTYAPEEGKTVNIIGDNLSNFANNAKASALDGQVYIRKIYTIPENDTIAPKPNPACYGVTTNPEEVQAVVDKAAELIGDSKLTWNKDIELYGDEFKDAVIEYYYDETILVITWRQMVNGAVCTCAEVKIADPSQLRRYLAGNGYGSTTREYATNMSSYVNAVIAINGDFYDFRQNGITVYQRKLYRFEPKYVDSCFFTSSGDMLFVRRTEMTEQSEAEQFIKDNDVLFALAFGPVLVDNGVAEQTWAYPIGEVTTHYSRAAIGQIDDLHYFLMTVNTVPGGSTAATINDSAQMMCDFGCRKAYALDGGQTAVMTMQGKTVNRVDWGTERTISDIIYFATAIPGK